MREVMVVDVNVFIVLLVLVGFVVATIYPNLFAIILFGVVIVMTVPEARKRWRQSHRK